MDAVPGATVVTSIEAAAAATAGSADALPVVDAHGCAVGVIATDSGNAGAKDVDTDVDILTVGSTVGTAMASVGSVRCTSDIVALAACAEVADPGAGSVVVGTATGITVVALTMGIASADSGAGNAADDASGGSSATGTDAGSGVVDIFSGSAATDADAGAGTVDAFGGSAATGTDTRAGIVGTTPATTGVPPSTGSEGASKDSTMVGITTEPPAHGSVHVEVESAGTHTSGAVSDTTGGTGLSMASGSRGPILGTIVVSLVVAVMGAAVAVSSGHSHCCNSGGHSQAPLMLSPNVFASPSTSTCSCHAAGFKSMSADAFKEVLATSATTGIAEVLASALSLHGATSGSTPMFTLHPTVISTSVIVR